MKKFLFPTIIAALLLVLNTSCYYDKFEDFKPKQACDTSGVTYNNKIKKIMDDKCNECHATPATLGGGIILDNYNSVKIVAQSGKLYSSVVWDGTAAQMPKGSFDKIDDCSINHIKIWIEKNYPQ